MAALMDKYVKEYNSVISEQQRQHPEHDQVIPRCVWIASKWSSDTGFVPWGKDAAGLLMALNAADPALFEEVMKGLQLMNDEMNRIKE